VLPHVSAVYPLAETACALRQVADGKAIGKVLIDLR
jgi:NADPH:quinone reductase